MKQPQRTQPSRTARAVPNTAPLTSPQFALCDVPRVLEHSTRRLEDFEQCAVTGPGILVKLFPVDDSNSTLWIVGSPHANKWIPSKMKEMRTANANAKAHDVAKVRKPSTHKTRTQLSSGHSAKQKKQGSPAQGGNKLTGQQVHGDQDESDDMSKEAGEDEEDEDEEEEKHEEDEDEDDAVEDNDAQEQDAGGKDSGDADADAREENVAGEQDAGEQDAGEQDTGEDDAAEDDAAKQDAGEQDAGEEGAGEEDAAKEDGEEEDNDAGGQDAGKDDAAEDGAAEDDAGKNMVGDLDNSEEGQDLQEGPKRDAVMDKENGHDAGEQEEDGNNEASDGTGNEDADDMEDKGYEGEEGLAESIGKEGEHEAEGQPEAEDQQEAEREGEREGKEVTVEEVEPHSEARGKDYGVHHGEEEEQGGDWEAETKQGDQDQCGGLEGSTGQRVTTNDRDGPWRSWKTGDTSGEEDDERCTNATGQEDTVEYGNARSDKRKRSSTDSILEEHLNKRQQSGRDWNGVDTTTVHSLDRAIGLKAQPRLQTPPPKSTIPSTPSTIEIVREASVVSGLEGTECAVWDAARRDSVVNSLPLEQQAKMIHTALCLGSKEGIDALRDFAQNAREESTRRRQALQSGAQTDTPHFGVDVWQATKTMNSRDSSLAQFSDLYRKVDILDNKVVLSSIAKRVQLAAMAEYRKSLLQEGAGRNQAKDINLHLFHTVYPDHDMIRDPDAKGTSSAARRDWNRMCNRLREGRMWFEVRDLFGGVGAFLALPPQCVSDRHLLRLPATTFSSWLGLLEVAWRALDMHARRTLNDLVRMSLAGQPLPDGLLALETLEDGPGTAPIILSDILTGWSLSEQKSRDDERESTSTTHREKDGHRAALGPPSTTAGTTNPLKKNDSALCAREMPDVDDGLLNDVEFDDGLSQEI